MFFQLVDCGIQSYSQEDPIEQAIQFVKNSIVDLVCSSLGIDYFDGSQSNDMKMFGSPLLLDAFAALERQNAPVDFSPYDALPKSKKLRRLSEAQQDALIATYKSDNYPTSQGTHNVMGAANIIFYERLAERHLIEITERFISDRKHCISYRLTEMGRSVASGLSDLPF